jgi:peptide/nickel transport system substrate-binding protein
MTHKIGTFVATSGLLTAMFATNPTLAQKQGGILRMYSPDSPASMSILEEATVFAERPMMGIFNNLVMFDQHVKQNSLQSIVPDLATGWSWNEDGTELTFPLRQDVKWHDGKPFTANDVKCTWDLLTGKSNEKLRVTPAGLGTAISMLSPPMAITRWPSTSSGRSRPF